MAAHKLDQLKAGTAGHRAARPVPLLVISGTYTPIHSDVLNRISGALPVRPFNQALLGPFAQHTRVRLEEPRCPAPLGAAGAFNTIGRFRWNSRPQ